MILRRSLILIAIAGLLGAVLSGYASLVAFRADKPWLLDFAKFYISAQALGSGGDIYRVVPIEHFGPLPDGINPTREHLHPNLNMPVVALLFWPFSHFGVTDGMAAWSLLSIGFAVASAGLLGSHLAASHGLPAFHRLMFSGVLAVLVLIYFPTWASAALGQLGQLLLLILCGAWIAARYGQDRLAGVLLGIALALKPFTGLFLLILPWLGRWRLMAWYAGSFAALALLGAVAAGPESYLRYLDALREVNWYASGWNASLTAPLSVLLGGGDAPGWADYPMLAKGASLGITAALYALLVVRLRRIEEPKARCDLAVAGAIPLMLLGSPLGWIYYFPLIWIAAAGVVEAVRPLPSRWVWWLSAAAVLALCGLPFPFAKSSEAGESLQSLLVTSADTMALLVAFAFVLAAAWRVSAQPQPARA